MVTPSMSLRITQAGGYDIALPTGTGWNTQLWSNGPLSRCPSQTSASQKLILELKAISGELGASKEQQLRNYMSLLNVERGMLINFQQPGRKQGKTRLDVRELAS